MALVLAIVLLVPVVYASVQTWLAWRAESERRFEVLDRTSRLIAAYQSDLVERTWTLLTELSEQPAIIEAREPACSALLLREVRQSQSYGTFAVTGRDGVVSCASGDRLKGATLSDRSWFRDVIDGGGPVVSEVLESRDGTSGRTVIAAMPLRAPGGPAGLPGVAPVAAPIAPGSEVTGTVAASLLLGRFTAVPNALPLPQRALAYVVDRAGAPLQFTAGGESVALPTAEENKLLVAGAGQPREIVGADGRRWLFLASPIARGQLAIITGLPVETTDLLRRDLLLGILVPPMMLALAVLAIWIATDWLVNRHIVALAAIAGEYGRGRRTPEPPTLGAPEEIKALARSLGAMAERVGSREAELQATIAQKDTLLREIHHRVKNNLQIVTSLLNLRAQRLVSPVARTALAEAQTRIKALALVHRHLYEQREVKTVQLHAFLGELCALIEDTTAPSRPVTLEVDVAPVAVATDRAIPLALLITEALSNAFKHAFPEGRSGWIKLRLARTTDGAVLEITDNGVGYAPPDGREKTAPTSPDDDAGEGDDTRQLTISGLGLTLIRMLARQIDGELTLVTGSEGTRLTLPFPLRDGG